MTGTALTIDRTRKVVADLLNRPITEALDDAELVKDLGADSLDRVELAMLIEDEFGVTVTDDEADAWLVVGDVINSVAKRQR